MQCSKRFQRNRLLSHLIPKPEPITLELDPSVQYTKLISKLKSPSSLSEARRLHALLLLAGFFHDRVLGSQVVNIYVSFGHFPEALRVFHRLPQKSNIAYNAILRGLVDQCRFSEAIEFYYHSMLSGGGGGSCVNAPDNYTYPLVLKACSGLSSLEEGKKVHEFIKRNNARRNIYVDCALIDMFVKCGSLRDAQQVFEEMPSRDLASWSALICGAVHNGHWLEALRLFGKMRLEGLRPDSVIVATLLPACGRLESKQMGMALQGCATRGGYQSDLFVSNALMDMYCKCGDTGEAYSVFCTMVDRDSVSWNTMIGGYAQNCLYSDSIDLLLEMRKRSSTHFNAVTATSAVTALGKLRLSKQGKEMHAYVLKQGFVSDVVLGSALIDMYVSCGFTREAEYIFGIMSDEDITIWNSMIAGHAFNGDTDEAFQVFRRIWEFKLKPNSITLLSILPLCANLGTPMHGKEIHGYATKSIIAPAVSLRNCLIDMYCKCGYFEDGAKVFHQMTEKNVVSYNTIISAHGIHGRAEEAFAFFDQMREARIRPNKVTFVALLSSCSHAGLVEKGWFFYNSMRDDYGIFPDMEHYTCMVDLLGRAGRLDDAWLFMKSMPVDPDVNVLGSLLGSCRAHNSVELAKLLGELILQKGVHESGHYVLLSNIYAFTKRWEDALIVRTVIKEKGLTKRPGCSWIQVGSHIHLFHAADGMHPEVDKIQEILKCCFFEMKQERFLSDSGFSSCKILVNEEELCYFYGT